MARETKGFVCLGQKEDEESGLEDKDDDAFSHTSSRSLGHMERLERWFELHIRQEYGPWDAVLILVYMGLTGCRFEAFDHYDTHTAYANKYAIFFTASLLSFVVAIVVAFVLEGDQTMKKLLSWNRFWHFACISVLWAFASLLWSSAYEIGPIPADAVVASCFYLPIATWLSELYFKERSYSMMAWFSVLIQTAAMATFLALRRRYRDCPVGAECGTEVALEYMRSHHSWLSAMITICSVMVSCVGSVLAEKLYLSWKHDSFAVLNAHVQFCGVIFHFIGWLVYANPMVPDAAPTKPLNASAIKDQAMSENLLPDMNWNALEWGLVFLIAAQGWAAGLVVKNFSTVSKSVLSGMATIGFLFVGDELERKYRYDIREKPALLLFLVLVLAGMLFQSSMVHSRDRRRTKKMERRAEIDESVTDESEGYVSPDEDGCCSTPWTQEREQEVVVPASQRLRLNSLNSAPVDDTGSSYLVSITVVYMITYVTVREFNSIAVSRSEINPTSLTMMTFLGGLLYACAMTYKAHGWDGTSRTYNELHYKGQGLKQALNPKKLMEFASASFLFALSQVCQNMAYASPGANPALISVVGTVYVPILAILNRLMGRRILWIEWIAIVILFLSTVVFGWLQSYDPVRGMVLETYQPILLVCLSATAAAFRDLKQNFLYLANRDALRRVLPANYRTGHTHGTMVRQSKLLGTIVVASAVYSTTKLLTAFVGTPSTLPQSRLATSVALQARGGGEYDVSDADIEKFYADLTTGSGGLPPKGNVVSEMVVKFFHGEFTKQGFKRYSGMWKGPPPGTIGKKDIAVGIEGLKEQMKNPMFVSKGGVGYGVDETQKVEDDGKGWVWLGAEMSPGGLALELFKSVPYGKRAVLVAKQDSVDDLFEKVNWEQATINIDKTLGGPQVKQR